MRWRFLNKQSGEEIVPFTGPGIYIAQENVIRRINPSTLETGDILELPSGIVVSTLYVMPNDYLGERNLYVGTSSGQLYKIRVNADGTLFWMTSYNGAGFNGFQSITSNGSDELFASHTVDDSGSPKGRISAFSFGSSSLTFEDIFDSGNDRYKGVLDYDTNKNHLYAAQPTTLRKIDYSVSTLTQISSYFGTGDFINLGHSNNTDNFLYSIEEGSSLNSTLIRKYDTSLTSSITELTSKEEAINIFSIFYDPWTDKLFTGLFTQLERRLKSDLTLEATTATTFFDTHSTFASTSLLANNPNGAYLYGASNNSNILKKITKSTLSLNNEVDLFSTVDVRAIAYG